MNLSSSQVVDFFFELAGILTRWKTKQTRSGLTNPDIKIMAVHYTKGGN